MAAVVPRPLPLSEHTSLFPEKKNNVWNAVRQKRAKQRLPHMWRRDFSSPLALWYWVAAQCVASYSKCIKCQLIEMDRIVVGVVITLTSQLALILE